ncbi:flagellar hook assembly protein FlgD [Pseudobutyrivibrio xylanivorans]|uniref:Basal-body rod modification protein FlgD n=1 Tax=Pseudobutyrivibrio xylanivorans TaxID=185007 RepID=A0A5P6VSW0_PSEXY|nr:flagellar hook capping FlgD N-terminal domain-containing protein [Pseudobutyrivibrio xylanivorans]QFJ55482.1 hypothetical protein FXF36_11685 [Pseudobutyrivibrio xylanivorans]
MAGLLTGAVTNGQYTKTQASQDLTKSNETTSTSKTAAKRDTGYNQDMFLQLLVAEMQYQDPLEPSDNSQYVAQLASFTQIEAIQSVQNDMHTMEANSLVGKTVVINSDHEEIEGKVDYVQSDDDGELYVSVNGNMYKTDEIISVVDPTYYNAVSVVRYFDSLLKDMPSVELVTLGDEKIITDIANTYNNMDAYTRSFINDDTVKAIEAVIKKFEELKKAKEEADNEVKNVTPVEENKESKEQAEETNSLEEAEAQEV